MHTNGLWRISDSGKLDDWERALANGLSGASDDPTRVAWWRYGSWIPDVACSLCGNHLIVSGRLKNRLASTRASFHRVKSLFVTDVDVDWRAWKDATASRHELLDRYAIDEPEEICCPAGDGKAPDPTRPLDDIRSGLVERRDADLWVVFGEESLQARRTPSLHCVGTKGAGIYCDPFLFRSYVCVESSVREILEAFGALATVEFNGMDVDWR